jgi:hypothetical protein
VHGHVALVHAMATRLGLPALWGPPCRERELAYALIVSRGNLGPGDPIRG